MTDIAHICNIISIPWHTSTRADFAQFVRNKFHVPVGEFDFLNCTCDRDVATIIYKYVASTQMYQNI